MPRFVDSYEKLARELGVTRQAIVNWRKAYDDAPVPLLDGTYDANKWRLFMREKGLGKKDVATSIRDVDEDESEEDGPQTKEDWNCALIREKVRRERIKADLESQKAVLVDDLEQNLGGLLAAVQNGMDSFPDRSAPMVQGFSDVTEISRILHGEMQSTLGALQVADFEKAVEETPEHLRAEVLAALKRIGGFYLERTQIIET
jgi:transcriptional regulator with XRE-family HTH domain